MNDKNRNISYQPTAGLCYDPNDKTYWQPEALQLEIERAFEICHGCRMCFKYCDSFPTLFSLIDDKYDGDVRKINAEETDQVMEQCFQCKLCEVQCPYTPRENHEFQLDFPRLVHRYKAVRAKRHKIKRREKVLGNPDLAGKMARASLGLANVMNRNGAHRWFLEKVLGIHREKLLPDFAGSTFENWASQAGKIQSARQEAAPEAVLFQTCYVQNNEPQIGRDTLEVLEKNQVPTACVKGLACCGMPAWESGDLERMQALAKHNMDLLLPFVERGAKVLAINPTCAMMMRREYPELVPPEEKERATKLADAIRDPSEHLWSIRNEPRFNTEFKSAPEEAVSYHAPCHLRAMAVGFKGRDLLRKIPGVKPGTVMECCGHDGTYAMKVEGFEPSARIGKKAFEGMKAKETEVWSTDCPLAALQFKQHAGVKPMHPMTILAKAYREDGFSRKLTDSKEDASS